MVNTWWHDSSSINTDTAMPRDEVRRSRKYNVSVSVAGEDNYLRSFVYETIPRNGNGKAYDPAVPGSEYNDTDDGISIEVSESINMAWSQFEYNSDVDVKIMSVDGSQLGPASNVKVRPSSLPYRISSPSSDTIIVRVPYSEHGSRFSVEFQNDLFQYRSNGTEYVLDGGLVVSEEPRNALLIFASPLISASLIVSKTSPDTHVMTPGPITTGALGSKPTLYFSKGIYWMENDGILGNSHMKLDKITNTVYLEPGTYIKGALEFTTEASDFYLLGHGVLSGENYVYQANWNQSYVGNKSDATSLRMIFHESVTNDQTFHLKGPTLNAPPFNTVDLFPKNHTDHEEDNKVGSDISDYKQVGAYYFQTDGSQLYAGVAEDIFWHANDDAIKLYHSNVEARNIIVWKVHNDPIIQMGWTPRDINNVTLSNVHVIHSRWFKSETGVPSSIIGASPYYTDPKLVDENRTISATINNLVCEGKCPALLRIAPMNNYQLNIDNVWYDDIFNDATIQLGQSLIGTKISDEEDDYTEGQDILDMGIKISNWRIGSQRVTQDNWKSDELGQLNFNATFWGQWSIS